MKPLPSPAFLCRSSFSLVLFRAYLDYDTSRKSLHCQRQQAAVFEVPSKSNYSMTSSGVCHGTKQHREVGTELATSHGSVLHFLEGCNACRLCPELPEGACCIIFSGQDSQCPARCVSLVVPTRIAEGYTARSQHTTSKCKSCIDFLPSVPNRLMKRFV